MSRALRFITRRRFNYFDAAVVGTLCIYGYQGNYVAMVSVWFLGALVSVVLERIAAGTEGRS
jgi:hypothetical protein